MKKTYSWSAAIFASAFISTSLGAQAEKPNILFIVAEDASLDFGCYGNKIVDTPHIDNLAAEGVRFAKAYTSYSVSSPSRGSILTGLYPHQNGQMGLATHRYQMFPGTKTLPKYMKELGYRTGNIGKLHVNPESEVPFDYWEIRGSNFAKKNLPAYAEKAKEFINSSEEPFYLQVNFPDSHGPFQRLVEGLPKKLIAPEDITESLSFVGTISPRLKEYTANYYNCINRLDDSVGMLLEALEETGKADNTIIIFISDHGAQFSRGKVTNYEGGLKIPFILRYPDKEKAGTVRDELVSVIDLLPTFIDIAGGQKPETLPGKSITALVERNIPWRKYLFAGGLGSYPTNTFPKRSVRDERFKLIVNDFSPADNPGYACYVKAKSAYAAGATLEDIKKAPQHVQKAYATWANPPLYELYDLQNDPDEWVNLADNQKYSAEFKRLKTVLHEWRVESGDMIVYPENLEKLRAEMKHIVEDNVNHRRVDFRYGYVDYLNPNFAR